MSIPPFQEDGLLPLGLHLAEMNEIAERFGSSTPRRQTLFERLRMFVDLAQHCGAQRMFVNGSYVTAKAVPDDVDVVIWLGERFLELLLQRDWRALLLKQMFLTRRPQEAFLVVDEKKWNRWFEFFSLLKQDPSRRKGLIEVKFQ